MSALPVTFAAPLNVLSALGPSQQPDVTVLPGPDTSIMYFQMLGFAVLMLLVFGLVYRWLDHRAKQAAERLRVLEDALKRGDLDRMTREEIVEALTGRRGRPDTPDPGPGSSHWAMSLSGFLGWMCLCLGVMFCFLLASNILPGVLDATGTAYTGAILCAVGFGLVSFPLVWRELQRPSRRNPREQES